MTRPFADRYRRPAFRNASLAVGFLFISSCVQIPIETPDDGGSETGGTSGGGLGGAGATPSGGVAGTGFSGGTAGGASASGGALPTGGFGAGAGMPTGGASGNPAGGFGGAPLGGTSGAAGYGATGGGGSSTGGGGSSTGGAGGSVAGTGSGGTAGAAGGKGGTGGGAGSGGGKAVEDEGTDCTIPALPAAGSLPTVARLPDPFTKLAGGRIATKAEWRCRRAEIKKQAETYAYGTKPPKPQMVTGTVTSSMITVNVSDMGRSASFSASVSLPSGTGPFPVVIILGSFGADTATIRSEGVATITFDVFAPDERAPDAPTNRARSTRSTAAPAPRGSWSRGRGA